jgi:hypothetical protein
MHKGIIILTKATSKDEAIDNVNEFMQPYGNGDVWDWWKIGGRWQNTLAPKEKLEKWHLEAKKLLKVKDNDFGISQKAIDKNTAALQAIWDGLELKGKHPYSDHYSLGDEGNAYDVVPLSDCIDTVRVWVRDMDKERSELWSKLLLEKSKADAGEPHSTGYYAGLYKDADYNSFSFESNVYDATEDTGETLPPNTDGYYAVMVDIHI